MQIAVYSGEKHDKGVRWYAIFVFVFAAVIAVSLLYRNIVGVIVLFFLMGGYLYFTVRNQQIVSMRVTDNAIAIGDAMIPWNALQGYVLEIDKRTEQIHNIVLVLSQDHQIYTIAEEDAEQFKRFVTALDAAIPMLAKYDQSTLQLLTRKLKL